jgi:hypothetical protein
MLKTIYLFKLKCFTADLTILIYFSTCCFSVFKEKNKLNLTRLEGRGLLTPGLSNLKT